MTEEKLFYHCGGTLAPMYCWKVLPLEESCRAVFLTVDELTTYVLPIFGTWRTELVSLYLSDSVAHSPSVSWPFCKISACMTGHSVFKSWALTLIRNIQPFTGLHWMQFHEMAVKLCTVEMLKWNSIKYAFSVFFLSGPISVFYQSILDIFIRLVIYVHCRMIRRFR